MRKYILSVIVLSLLSLQAYAEEASCHGTIHGEVIEFTASGHLKDYKNGEGSIIINGEEVAQFSGSQVRVNFFTKSFSATNSEGDLIKGKLLSIQNGTAVVTELIIKGENVALEDIQVECQVQ